MLPSQKFRPYNQAINQSPSIRSILKSSSPIYTGKLVPNSPLNNHTPMLGSPQHKSFSQSYSTNVLPNFKHSEPNGEQGDNSFPKNILIKDRVTTEMEFNKTKTYRNNFQRIRSFLSKQKQGINSALSTAKKNIQANKNQKIKSIKNEHNNFSPQKADILGAQHQNRPKKIYSPSKTNTFSPSKANKFSPSKTNTYLQGEKQNEKKTSTLNHEDVKAHPKAYLRMTLDPRFDQKSPFLSQKQGKNNLIVKKKSPRASHKPESSINQGSFWKNKLPRMPVTQTKKQSGSIQKIKKRVSQHFKLQNQIETMAQQHCQTLKIPLLKLNGNQNSNGSKTNFIPYRKNLNRFQIIKKLGIGIFADNYLGIDKKSSWMFCLKIIRKASVLNAPGQALSNFIKQLKLQFIIDDPNIVTIYDIFCDDQFVYILEELMTDGTIKSSLNLSNSQKGREEHKFESERNGKSEEDRRDIEIIEKISGINSALETIHSLYRIPHGNINPQSIHLTFDVPKISKFVHREELAWRKTPLNYTPPEMLVGVEVSCNSDMWCLGLLLFELASQETLFECESSEPNALAQKILELKIEQELFRLKIVSKPIKQIIRSLLKINPQERINSTNLLTTSLLGIYQSDKIIPEKKGGKTRNQTNE